MEIKSGEELTLLIKIIKNIKDYDKIFNKKDSHILRKLSDGSLNVKEKSTEKRKSSDKSIFNLSKQPSSSNNLTTSGNKAILTTLTNSNTKKNQIDKSVIFTESQNNITNSNNYYSNYNNSINSNLNKSSFGNLGNLANSAKIDVKNTIPDRGDSNPFFNLSIGFDKMSNANLKSNIHQKIEGIAAKGNSGIHMQTNANLDNVSSKVINTKENIRTENFGSNEGEKFFSFLILLILKLSMILCLII